MQHAPSPKSPSATTRSSSFGIFSAPPPARKSLRTRLSGSCSSRSRRATSVSSRYESSTDCESLGGPRFLNGAGGGTSIPPRSAPTRYISVGPPSGDVVMRWRPSSVSIQPWACPSARPRNTAEPGSPSTVPASSRTGAAGICRRISLPAVSLPMSQVDSIGLSRRSSTSVASEPSGMGMPLRRTDVAFHIEERAPTLSGIAPRGVWSRSATLDERLSGEAISSVMGAPTTAGTIASNPMNANIRCIVRITCRASW